MALCGSYLARPTGLTSHLQQQHAWKPFSARSRTVAKVQARFEGLMVQPILKMLRRKRYEPSTIERIYEADMFPPVFDFEAWHNHRSRARYLDHVTSLFSSYLLRALSGPLVDIALIAVIVCTYETLLENGSLPNTWPNIAVRIPEPFNQTSFALSLMLVFRTNSSYARWMEARTAWGRIINSGRNLLRQALSAFPDDYTEMASTLGRWTVAFARACKLHLREDGNSLLDSEMRGVLAPEELQLLREAHHRPIKALQVMAEIVCSVPLDAPTRSRLDADITHMEHALGDCERILKNPIPLSYTRHTARFLVFWLSLLPFTLWTKLGWGVVPACVVIGFLLLGIDEIGIQLEEPFGIMPLENLCDTVHRNVVELVEDNNKVKNLVGRYSSSTMQVSPPEGWGVPPPRTTGSSSDEEVEHHQLPIASTLEHLTPSSCMVGHRQQDNMVSSTSSQGSEVMVTGSLSNPRAWVAHGAPGGALLDIGRLGSSQDGALGHAWEGHEGPGAVAGVHVKQPVASEEGRSRSVDLSD